MLNFTNPAGMISELLMRYSKHKKIIGLCNVPIALKMQIAKMWNVNIKNIKINFAGLNIYINGEDKTKETIERITKIDADLTMRNIVSMNAEPELLKGMGVLLCPYHRYYFMFDEMLAKQLKDFNDKGETRASIVKKIETSLFKKYTDVNLDVKPPELQERGGAYYSDIACELLQQIHTDANTGIHSQYSKWLNYTFFTK